MFYPFLFALVTLWVEVGIHKYMGWSLLWWESFWAFPLFCTYAFVLGVALNLGINFSDWMDNRKP